MSVVYISNYTLYYSPTPLAISIAIITNIFVFFLLLIQVIRHKKWKYCLYWCFIVQSVFDSLLAVIDHLYIVSLPAFPPFQNIP